MTVKLKIRELRLNHPDKPTQRFMGDLLGMTESNYRKLESNSLESVKFDHLDKLVKFFNCKIDEMMEYIND
jgi:DNA-binding Xre family transcriptional regulator